MSQPNRPNPYIVLKTLDEQKPVFERLYELGYIYSAAEDGSSLENAWECRARWFKDNGRAIMVVTKSKMSFSFYSLPNPKDTLINSPAQLYSYLAHQ